jgi:nitric oxide reductase subunit C
MKAPFVFLTLVAAFLVYSTSIYLRPLRAKRLSPQLEERASQGRLVYEKYNCQACHQLYGLGGYLGPDLTNVFGDPYKGEPIIRAFVRSGIKQMPAFEMSDEELDLLIDFLKSVDAGGVADPRQFEITPTGMIHPKIRK